MNKLKLAGLLAVFATLGMPLIAHADSYSLPTAFQPISSSTYFQSTYNGVVQNGIFSAGAISDFSTFLSANLINLLVAGVVLWIVGRALGWFK